MSCTGKGCLVGYFQAWEGDVVLVYGDWWETEKPDSDDTVFNYCPMCGDPITRPETTGDASDG